MNDIMYVKHIIKAQQILAIMIMFLRSPLELHKSELERSGLRPRVLSSMIPSGL